MPVVKSRPRSNSQKSDSFDKGKKKRIKPSKSKTGLKSSSSSSAKSSPDSGGSLITSSSAETAKIPRTSNSTPSENERNYSRKMSCRTKPKVKSKLKKKTSAREKTAPMKAAQESTHSFDKSEPESIESLANDLNETLRWHNVCSDSDEEEERLRIYKEKRRKRYAEALQVRVLKRMAEK